MLRVVAVLVLVAYPFLYIGMYAGDSEIHLVYAEHAAQGHFFEFNPGEKSPGVTSPGYMLVLAGLFKLLPEAAVPLVIKLTNLLIWYAFVGLVFVQARRLLSDNIWPWIVTLCVGLNPGGAYNATSGMENGAFACMVMLWLELATRAGWFRPMARSSAWHDSLLAALLGAMCWLRPEGFVFAALAFLFRLYLLARGRSLWSAVVRLVLPSAALALIGAGVIGFHWHETGYLLPSSGQARMLAGHAHAIYLGPLPIAPKFALRLAAYAPLTLLALVGQWFVVRNRWQSEHRALLIFMAAVFWVFFILYSSALGSAHLARYTIFLLPMLAMLAGVGGKLLAARWLTAYSQRHRKQAVSVCVILALALLAVFAYETARRRALGLGDEALLACQAPLHRREFTDRFLRELGNPEARPVNVACQEVQIRYWLDDRFVVRSLDGRVDPQVLTFVHQGNFDHIGYLKKRNVHFVLETPNYNRDPERWSLSRLRELKPDESVTRGGLRFRRIGDSKYFHVEPEHGYSGG